MVAFRYLFGVSLGTVAIAVGSCGTAVAQNLVSLADRNATAQSSSFDLATVSATDTNNLQAGTVTSTSETKLAFTKTLVSQATSSATGKKVWNNPALAANFQTSETVNFNSNPMQLAQLPQLPENNQENQPNQPTQQNQQNQQNQPTQQNPDSQLEEYDESLEPVEDTEQLNPNANPLQLPTKTEEVEVDEVTPITLEQALKLARENNQSFREARLNLNQAKQQLQEALGAEFPTLSLQSDFQRSTSATSDIDPTDPGGVSTNLDTTLQLNYDIYTGGRRSSEIARAEAQVRLQQLALEQAAEELRLDVTNAYYQVQEADSQVEIARAAVEDAEQSVRDAKLLQEAGLGTRFDVLQAEVDLANEEQNLTRAISQRRTSRRQLVQVLGLGQQIEVTAATPPQVAGSWDLSLEESIVQAFQNRAELQQQLAQRRIGQENKDIALANLKPQVSLFTRYNFLSAIDIPGDTGTGPEFGDGLAIGAQLQWNFYDGGQSQARARQAEQDVAIAENGFDQVRNQIRLEVEQAFYELQANKDNIDTARLAVTQAEESLRLARLRFQAGVGTQTDVINAQSALTQARGNLLTAIIEYNRSLAALRRAVSNYPDNRLFDTP